MFILFIFFLDVLFSLAFASLFTPLPLYDSGTVRYKSFAWMTLTLIGINTLIFCFWQLPDLFTIVSSQDPDNLTMGEAQAFYGYVGKIWTYGFRPIFLQDGQSIGAFTTFTSMFMHANFTHLIGNMIFLWAFGRRLEDACGPWRFLLFYLLAGMVATMGAAFLVSVNSDVPGIGASGAISGVMGGYLLLFPGARMECLWLIISIPRSIINRFLRLMGGEAKYKSTIKLPAIVVVLLFVASDIIETFTTAQTGELIGGVNYVAHATGFLAAITIFLFVRKDLAVRYFAGRSI